jgi:putative transposase
VWRQGGFAAVVPSPRQTPLRTDADILDVAAALKRENPARTAAQVRRILVAAKGWAPSESTLLRLFHRLELPGADGRTNGDTVFGRFEAGDPNELWTGDALHGRRLGGRKTYLFAFIDDHSRLLPGYRWGFAEDTVRLAAPFRQAVQSRGIPQALYVDNGSAYIDSWLLRACAKCNWSGNAVHLCCGDIEDINLGRVVVFDDGFVVVFYLFGDEGDSAGAAGAGSITSRW